MSRLITVGLILLAFNGIFGQSMGRTYFRNRELLRGLVLLYDYRQGAALAPFGTGVIVDPDPRGKVLLLITNRHIVINRDSLLIASSVNFERNGFAISGRVESRIYTKGANVFVPSTADSDFAVLEIPRTDGRDSVQGIPMQAIIEFEDIALGQDVRFLGYPLYADLGLDASEFKLPIVRSGCVAFIANQEFAFNSSQGRDSRLHLLTGMFLIDGTSFGGNSGGPVFAVFQNAPQDPTDAQQPILHAGAIAPAGIICGHIPLSKRTKLEMSKMRIVSKTLDSLNYSLDTLLFSQPLNDLELIYEENSDLAIAVSFSTIRQFYNTVQKSK